MAIRSDSARTLLAGGTIVALWIAPGSGLPEIPYALKVIGWLLAFGLPTLAVVKAMAPWRPTGRSPAAAKAVATSRPVDVLRALSLASGRPWPVLAAALLAVGLATVTPYGEAEPPDERRAAAGAFSGPARYASRSTNEWRLYADDGTATEDGHPLVQARADVGPGRAAPLALSGDGLHVVYLDDATGRLVMLDLSSGVTHELTDPLPRGSAPTPAISHDGRYVSVTTATGVELVDTRTNHRTKLPEIHRVLGFGPGGLVATTGRLADVVNLPLDPVALAVLIGRVR